MGVCVYVYVLFLVYHVLCIIYCIYFIIWYPAVTSDDCYAENTRALPETTIS